MKEIESQTNIYSRRASLALWQEKLQENLTNELKASLVIQLMTPQKTFIWIPESALTHTFVTVLAGLG